MTPAAQAVITTGHCLKVFFGYLGGWVALLAGGVLCGLAFVRVGGAWLARKENP